MPSEDERVVSNDDKPKCALRFAMVKGVLGGLVLGLLTFSITGSNVATSAASFVASAMLTAFLVYRALPRVSGECFSRARR